MTIFCKDKYDEPAPNRAARRRAAKAEPGERARADQANAPQQKPKGQPMQGRTVLIGGQQLATVGQDMMQTGSAKDLTALIMFQLENVHALKEGAQIQLSGILVNVAEPAVPKSNILTVPAGAMPGPPKL